ncbi:MAG: hypothetical protein IKX32_03915, partial [Bacteroidales bacterium]|nr:hypothetical protein [Bacteroidales bacterium]
HTHAQPCAAQRAILHVGVFGDCLSVVCLFSCLVLQADANIRAAENANNANFFMGILFVV